MKKFLVRRLAESILVIFLAISFVFGVVRLVPGNPAELIFPPWAAPEQVARMEAELGLDRPVPVQYAIYMKNLLRGDMGESFRYRESALGLVFKRVKPTAELAFASLLIALVVAVPVGVLAAAKPNSIFDNFILSGVLLGQALPTFWWGIMLVLFFAVGIHLFPTSGYGTWRHLVLPALALSTSIAALLVRMVRSGLLEVLNEDYIRTARAKGVQDTTVLLKHAFRNALIPVITVVGLQLGTLLGGAVVTEAVFNWPGLGSLLVDAINMRDYPVIQATVFLMTSFFIALNLVTDLLYATVDPRIRVQ